MKRKLKITKGNGSISLGGEDKNNDMELINAYARKELKEEDVYTFSLVLCDNEVDRDYEAFSVNALEKLSKLFVGKTGIFDHEARAKNQCARIYKCEVKSDGDRLSSLGEKYCYLEAKAYIPVSEREIIDKIESGILREVSVSCSADRTYCSVCGKEHCKHITGKCYGGVKAVRILDSVSDAYEFSFVAIPAQRNARVKKNYSSFKEEDDEKMSLKLKAADIIEKLKDNEGEVNLSFDEAREIYKLCESGMAYRQKLENSIAKCFFVTGPGLDRETIDKMTENLDSVGLEKLYAVMQKEANKKLPLDFGVTPQTASERKIKADSEFKEYSI